MTVSNSLRALNLGYTSAYLAHREREVRQGGNNALATRPQSAHLFIAINYIPLLARMVPHCGLTERGASLCRYASVISIPVPYILEKMQSGTLGAAAKIIATPFVYHLGNALQVAIITAGVALVAFGHVLPGMAIVLPEAIQIASHSLGLLPEGMSRAVEQYLGVVSHFSMLVYGSLLLRSIAAIHIAVRIPGVVQKMQDLFQMVVCTPIPLSAFEALLETRSELDFETLQQCLDPNQQMELAPAHCGKLTFPDKELPKSENFDLLQTYFNSVAWEKKYPLIASKLKDDEKCLETLECTKEEFDQRVDALRGEQSRGEYVRDYLQRELNTLLLVLKKEGAISGTIKDRDEVIKDFTYIMPYLETIQNDRVAFEDALLKITIEGGGYCLKGILRMSRELREAAKYAYFAKERTVATQVYDYLEQKRRALVDATIREEGWKVHLMQRNFGYFTQKWSGSATDLDIHVHGKARRTLGMGFLPVDDFRREELDIIGWNGLAGLRQKMIAAYSKTLIADIRAEIGDYVIANYVRELAPDSETIANSHPDYLARTMLYALGVLRPIANA